MRHHSSYAPYIARSIFSAIGYIFLGFFCGVIISQCLILVCESVKIVRMYVGGNRMALANSVTHATMATAADEKKQILVTIIEVDEEEDEAVPAYSNHLKSLSRDW